MRGRFAGHHDSASGCMTALGGLVHTQTGCGHDAWLVFVGIPAGHAFGQRRIGLELEAIARAEGEAALWRAR